MNPLPRMDAVPVADAAAHDTAGDETPSALICPTGTAAMQADTFARRCAGAGCHGSTSPALGLDLLSPNLEARLLGAPSIGCRGEKLLVAGHPEQSELFRKVAHTAPECGLRMPVALPAYDSGEVECLRRWIMSLTPVDAGTPDAGGGTDTALLDASPEAPSPVCPAGQTACGQVCVDLTTNNDSCGACSNACRAGTTCSGSACICTGGLTSCSGTCVDLKSSAGNCGACGKVCTTGMVCSGGACVRGGCPAGTTTCDGACVDTSRDTLNCGSCGKACGAGSTCAAGACACASGLTACGSSCVNTAADSANCGGCGKLCPAGSSCTSGACTTTCPSGTTLCGGTCATLVSDPKNCGACGRTCASGEMCIGGSCVGCGPPVSFAAQVQPIFNASCTTGCHSGNRPAGGVALGSGVAYAEMVNVASTCRGLKHVAPGSPQTSYLINKLVGMGMCSGSIMPKAGGELPQAQIDLVRAWICQGAPNN